MFGALFVIFKICNWVKNFLSPYVRSVAYDALVLARTPHVAQGHLQEELGSLDPILMSMSEALLHTGWEL